MFPQRRSRLLFLADILSSRDRSQRRVAIFEAKYSKTPEAMRKDCHAALQQIKDRKYAKDYEDGRTHIFCYGIAFYKKECLILK